MFGSVSLQYDAPLFIGSSGTSRNLRNELESAFARPIIAKIKRGVRFQYTNQCNVAEVVSFCNHLRAHENVRFFVAERGQNLEITVFAHGGVVVHTQNAHAGNELFELVHNFFGADTSLFYLVATAIGTLSERMIPPTAIVTFELVVLFVVSERYIAIFTLGYVSAFFAFYKRRKASSIEEKHCLLPSCNGIFECFLQRE